MSEIKLELSADVRVMLKAMKDAEAAMRGMAQGGVDGLSKMEKQARDTEKALSGLGRGLNPAEMRKQIDQINHGLGATGMTAKQTAAALRGVPAQITDIFVSLQGGQNPMTVLFQQGGQLKDMFGGIVPAAKALGSTIMAMVNPFTLVAGAVIGLVAAIRSAGKEQEAFRLAIANTGNAAGVSVDQLNGMAEAMGAGFGKTSGAARDALAAMVATGQVARRDLQQFAETAMNVERVTGQSVEKTAENFAALGRDPVAASLKLTGTMNYLTVETYKQIKAAQDLGNEQLAASIAQQAYADAEEARIRRAAENLGYIDRAWNAVTSAVMFSWKLMKEAWDWLKSIGRDAPIAEQIAEIRKELDLYDKGLRSLSDRQVQAYKDQLANLQEVQRASSRASDAEAERVAANAAGIKALVEAEKNAGKVKAENDRAEKQRLKELQEARQRELDVGVLRNKLAEENAKREAQLTKDMIKMHEDLIRPMEQAAKSAEDRVRTLEIEEQAVKIAQDANVSLAQAVEMVNIAKLKEKQIEAMGNEDAVAAIQREIEAREKLVELIGSKEARDASEKAAKKAASDWEKATEKIQDLLTNALMRGFESGKGFAQSLKDAITNMFKTFTVQVLVKPILQSMTGGLAGMLGMPASAGDMGILKDILGAGIGGSTLAAIGSSIGTGIMAGMTGQSVAGAASAYSAAGMTGVSTGLTAGAAAAPFLAAIGGMYANNKISNGFEISKTVTALQNIATTLAAFIPGLGPLASLAIGVGSGIQNRLWGRKAPEIRSSGISGTFGMGGADVQAYADIVAKGGVFRSDKKWTEYSAVSSELDMYLDKSLKGMSKSVLGFADTLGLSKDGIEGFTQAIKINLKGLSDAEAQAAIEKAITGFGDSMANKLLGASEFIRGSETALQALTRMGSSLSAVNFYLGAFNDTLLESSLASGDAASKLVDLFGGLENFNSALGSYYQNFYTGAERESKQREQLQKAFEELGMTTPTTIEEFKALVDAQDLTTEAGRENFAALMALQGVFAQLNGTVDEATQKWAQLGAAMMDEVERIRSAIKTQATDYGMAAFGSEFAIATAAARAGNQTAAGRLPGLSQQYLEAAARQARTAEEFALIQAQIAASLEETNSIVTGQPISVNAPIATSTQQEDTKAMRAQIETLNAKIAELNTNSTAENRAMVDNLAKLVRMVDDMSDGGQSLAVVTRNGDKVETV